MKKKINYYLVATALFVAIANYGFHDSNQLLPLSEAGKGRPAGHGRDNRKHRNTKTEYK